MLWAKKHSPKTLAEIAGNDDAKEDASRWALEFERGKKEKPLLLHGPPGVGKTALAEALASEMGWSIIEANASDLRDAETMQKLFGLSSSSKGLLGTRRLLLIDEVDAARDRGEFAAIAQIIRESSQPIVFTANDLWEQSLSPIRMLCKPVEFKKVNAKSTAEVLKRIAKKEGVQAREEDIEKISKNCAGDVRAAINDLQASCGDGTCEIAVSAREREKNVFEAVRGVLKAEKFNDALGAFEGVDEEPGTFLLWLEENVPNEYENAEEVARAFEALSRADVYLGRVRKTRDWGFLRFARAVMLGGVALAKDKKYYKFARYAFPSAIRSLSSSRKSRELLKKAALKAGAKTHLSSREAKKSLLPFLWNGEEVAEYFGFDEDELKHLSETYGFGKARRSGKRK